MEMLGYMGSVFLLTLGHNDQSPTDSEDVVIPPDKNAEYTHIYYTITAAPNNSIRSFSKRICDAQGRL